MTEILSQRGHIQKWLDAAAGAPDWDGIFDGYEAVVDFPACTYWEPLAAHYPGTKILLSVRDADAWARSAQKTIMSERMSNLISGTRFGDMIEHTTSIHFGSMAPDLETLKSAYERHNAEVIEKAPSERLLVYDVKEGWQPLCEFLQVDVPATDFPRVNSSEEFGSAFAFFETEAGRAALDGQAPQ